MTHNPSLHSCHRAFNSHRRQIGICAKALPRTSTDLHQTISHTSTLASLLTNNPDPLQFSTTTKPAIHINLSPKTHAICIDALRPSKPPQSRTSAEVIHQNFIPSSHDKPRSRLDDRVTHAKDLSRSLPPSLLIRSEHPQEVLLTLLVIKSHGLQPLLLPPKENNNHLSGTSHHTPSRPQSSADARAPPVESQRMKIRRPKAREKKPQIVANNECRHCFQNTQYMIFFSFCFVE